MLLRINIDTGIFTKIHRGSGKKEACWASGLRSTGRHASLDQCVSINMHT
jgi:hypothetical protein